MSVRPTTAPLRIGHGARPLASESHWLLSTAGKWTEEDEKEWKRQQHRENMVFFRRKKKEQQAELRNLHQQLEHRLQQHLAMQRRAAARASRAQHRPDRTEQKRAAVVHLIAETEALKIENTALRDRIDNHKTLRESVVEAGDGIESNATEPTSSVSSRDGSNSDSSLSGSSLSSGSSSLSYLLSLQRGWRVHFPDGEPSFHFHPFSKEQLDAVRQGYDAKFAMSPPMEPVGNMFGWDVERAPLMPHPTLNVLISRVRYTRRIHCAGGSAHGTMDKLDVDSWPVLTTPELWQRIHGNVHVVTSQVLQAVDEDTYVIARNTPNPTLGVNVRYLNLVSRLRLQLPDGRRSISYALVVVTSDANKRSREAEPEAERRRVHWVNEGGAYMTLTQLDNDTLEVVYDHCSGCMNEQHAQYCLVDWGHIVIRWEQLVTPSRTLAF